MQHHEKYSRTIRRSESGLTCGCAAVAAVLACVAPCFARHNRVTVTTYGGAAGTVVDDEGTIRQCTMFYPSGLPVQLFGTERVTDRAHIGNRWSGFAGLGWHDNTARWHDAILDRFTTPDPKSAESPSHSTYVFCSGNPINRIDFDGKKDWPVPRAYNGHTRRHSNNYGEYRGRRLPHQGLDINLGRDRKSVV